MPSDIRQFPLLRYAITINGAALFDTETGDNIYRAEIPLESALEIMTYLDQFPIVYDCYKDNTGWMTQSMWHLRAGTSCAYRLIAQKKRL